MLVIEPAEPEEVDALIRMAAESLAADTDGAWLAEAAVADCCMVARDGPTKQILGFALARREDLCQAHLLALAVDPHERNLGVGAALLHRVESEMQRSGARTLWLEVRSDNPRAQAFYTRHGFHPEGLQSHVYSDGADAVALARPL